VASTQLHITGFRLTFEFRRRALMSGQQKCNYSSEVSEKIAASTGRQPFGKCVPI